MDNADNITALISELTLENENLKRENKKLTIRLAVLDNEHTKFGDSTQLTNCSKVTLKDIGLSPYIVSSLRKCNIRYVKDLIVLSDEKLKEGLNLNQEYFFEARQAIEEIINIGIFGYLQYINKEVTKIDKVFPNFVLALTNYDKIRMEARRRGLITTQLGGHGVFAKFYTLGYIRGKLEETWRKKWEEWYKYSYKEKITPQLALLFNCNYNKITKEIIKNAILEDLDQNCKQVGVYQEITKIIEEIFG